MKTLNITAPLAFCVLVLLPIASHADEWHGNVALTSDYVFRGFTQTQSDPAVQGGIDYNHESGFYAGAWASNVESDPSAPVNYDGASVEVDLYAGWSWALDTVSFDIGALRYQYPGTRTGTNNTNEFHVGAAWSPDPVELSAAAHYSPDYFGANAAWYFSIGAEHGLPAGFSMALSYGSTRYEDAARGDDYADWQVGLSRSVGGFDLLLGYHATSGVTGDCGPDVCDGRAVVTVARSF